MSRFFIDRPIFAWVIALIIMLIGILAITRLPISRYPNIAPPSVSITAVYPGASAKTAEDSVTQIIEQNMTGIDGLMYIASTSDGEGNVSITLTFSSGTNPDTAQVQVQNKLQQAMPLLPQVVQLQGISVTKASNSALMYVGFISEDGRLSAGDIGDYLSSSVLDPMNRVSGVGSVEVLDAKYAMRIWLDPDKLKAYGLTPADVASAVQAQNAQLTVGQLGGTPSIRGQQINATVTALGRLQTPEQFRNIVLRSNAGSSTLRLREVARVELGQADYTYMNRFNGKPASALGIHLATGANALATADGVASLLDKLRPQLPKGLKVVIPFDETPYVRKSIEEVIKTLAAAIVLVFLVMWLFLQNLRATLIPTIAVPVVLLGTFGVLAAAGYTVNMLTMFAVVLAIGLLVDDAIIVVENVERLMSEEGLTPVEATRRSMDQITGALVGIASVLSAVFLPMAFLRGSTGVIYRQFSVTIVSAMVLSVIVAIVLTPALCATLLQPVTKGGHHSERGLFRWFNRQFDRSKRRYQDMVARILGRPNRYLVIYLGLASLMGVLFLRLAHRVSAGRGSGSLDSAGADPGRRHAGEDRKGVGSDERLFPRSGEGGRHVGVYHRRLELRGGGQNVGIGFVQLRDWSVRKAQRLGADALQARANTALAGIRDAMTFVFSLPPVFDLGDSAGFDFFLKDTDGQGHAALTAARDQFLELAAKDNRIANVRASGLDDAPQFRLDIDAEKAASFGVSLSDVNDTLRWRGVGATSTISSIEAASSTSSCRRMHRFAWCRRTSSAGRCAMPRATWCRSPRSPIRIGNTARRASSATTACLRWKSTARRLPA